MSDVYVIKIEDEEQETTKKASYLLHDMDDQSFRIAYSTTMMQTICGKYRMYHDDNNMSTMK